MTETATVTQAWRVSGMHCSNCGILIDEAVEELDGVTASTTSVRKRVTTVTYDPAACTPDQITHTILETGYRTSAVTDTKRRQRRLWPS